MEQLDIIVAKLSQLEINAAAVDAHHRAQKENIERFWSKDWADLLRKLDALSTEQIRIERRLHLLELNIHPLPERTARLEGKVDAIEKRFSGMSMAVIVIGITALGNAGKNLATLFPL